MSIFKFACYGRINLPYDDLFVPRMGSVTFAGRFYGTRWGGGVGGTPPLREASPKRGMARSGETDTSSEVYNGFPLC